MHPAKHTSDQRSAHIDVSLIKQNLKLTPRQRLEQLETLVNDMDRIRQAVRSKPKPASL